MFGRDFQVFSLLTSVLILVSCTDCIEGEGPLLKESREVGKFSEVRLMCSAKVMIVSNDTQPAGQIEVTGKGNIIPHLLTKTSGNVLTIDLENGCYSNTGQLEIRINSGAIEQLSNEGSGEIECADMLRAEGFKIFNEGSGSLVLMLTSASVDIVNEGSGDVSVEGNCHDVKIVNEGSGSVDTFRIEAEKAKASNDGSGDIRLFASKELEVKLNGSGSVRYGGNPSKSSLDDSGSGSITSEND